MRNLAESQVLDCHSVFQPGSVCHPLTGFDGVTTTSTHRPSLLQRESGSEKLILQKKKKATNHEGADQHPSSFLERPHCWKPSAPSAGISGSLLYLVPLGSFHLDSLHHQACSHCSKQSSHITPMRFHFPLGSSGFSTFRPIGWFCLCVFLSSPQVKGEH